MRRHSVAPSSSRARGRHCVHLHPRRSGRTEDPHPSAVDDASKRIDVWAKGIRERTFTACPGDHCKHCDVREICRHRKG